MNFYKGQYDDIKEAEAKAAYDDRGTEYWP